jgi:hypothetical protein
VARGLALNDGFPIGFERGLDGRTRRRLDTLARDPASSVHALAIRDVALLDGTLRIAIDALGFAKVYRARSARSAWAESAERGASRTARRASRSKAGPPP